MLKPVGRWKEHCGGPRLSDSAGCHLIGRGLSDWEDDRAMRLGTSSPAHERGALPREPVASDRRSEIATLSAPAGGPRVQPLLRLSFDIGGARHAVLLPAGRRVARAQALLLEMIDF